VKNFPQTTSGERLGSRYETPYIEKVGTEVIGRED
jgi:hypothetical protein